WDFGDGALEPGGGPTASHTYPSAGSFTARVTVSDGQASASATVAIAPAVPGGGLPPEPATVPPALAPSAATDVRSAPASLYTGTTPIQTGVAPGTIDARRAAVLRGRVLDRAGAPLGGVTITLLGHPEFGQTRSRADGMFDIAVNGGGPLTVRYEQA